MKIAKLFTVLVLLCNIGFAATIRVPSEQPNIQAGIDYATDGDTVLVSNGVYSGTGNQDIKYNGKNIVVTSANGPDYTIIDCGGYMSGSHRGFTFDNGENLTAVLKGFTIQNGLGTYSHSHYEGGAIMIDGASPTISNCVFSDNNGPYQGGAASCFYSYAVFQNCTFVNNTASYGGAIYANRSHLIINNCIIAFTKDGGGVYDQSSTSSLNCCDVYGNVMGDYIGEFSDILDNNGNISLDPLFCDTVIGNYHLNIESPCSPAYNPSCGLIGALTPGCSGNFALPFPANFNVSPVVYNNVVTTDSFEFSWFFYDTTNVVQTAYELEIGTDEDWTVAETWSSGQVLSGDSNIVYTGPALNDFSEYYCRIRISNGIVWGEWVSILFRTHFQSRTVVIPDDFGTIQEGINRIIDGDTVLVHPGEYEEQIDFIGKAIVVKSSGGAQVTTINNTVSDGPVVNFSHSEDTLSILDGFKIVGTSTTACIYMNDISCATIRNNIIEGSQANTGGGISCGSNAKIIGNEIRNNSSAGFGGGIYASEAENLLIENNIIYDNSSNDGGGAMALLYCNSSLIQYNLIYSNTVADDRGGVVYSERSTEITFANNTIYGNQVLTGESSGIYLYRPENWEVHNNIIVNNLGGVGLLVYDGSGVNLSCNDVHHNELGNYIGIEPGVNDISSDPLFCNSINFDLRINAASHCSPYVNAECGLIGALGPGCQWNLPHVIDIVYGPDADNNIVFSEIPEFSWTYFDTSATNQAAYEVEVGIDENWSMAELWSSGQVYSTEQTAIYAGLALFDNTDYYVRIRVSDGSVWGEWISGSFFTHFDNIANVPTEYPNIQAGIDNSRDGDTVLVADGIYTGVGNHDIDFLGKNIVVKSESGPENCIVDCEGSQANPHRGFIFINDESNAAILEGFTIRNGFGSISHGHNEGGAIMIDSASPTIKKCLFYDNSGNYQGGAAACFYSEAVFTQCTFVNNYARYGSGIYSNNSILECNNCIVAFNSGSNGIWENYGSINLTCCDIFGNEYGDWVEGLASQLGDNGNISADPQFCDIANNDFSVSLFSACSPYISGSCGLIGCMEAGCSEELPMALNIHYTGTSPDGIVIVDSPGISWTYFDTAATVQTYYEIEVGTDEDWSAAEMWASGQVASSDTSAIYAGAELENNGHYYLRMHIHNGTTWGGWSYSEFSVHYGSVILVPSEIPTIQEAINLATDWDTVLVADGVYTGIGNRDINFIGKRIVVKSENGPDNTIIECEGSSSDPHRGFVFTSGENNTTILQGFTVRNGYGPYSHSHYEGGAILMDQSSPTIMECVFINNRGDYQGGAICCFGATPQFINCTFANNRANYGGGIYSNGANPYLTNCLIAFNTQGSAIDGSATLECCDIYGNTGGDWHGNISSQLGFNGNISEDPMFCDALSDNYHIAYTSICSPSVNIECGLIGALEQGCQDNLPTVLNINYGPEASGDTVHTLTPEIYWSYYDTLATGQIMYEIEVGVDQDWATAEMWYSGAVSSADTSAVYAGSSLGNGTKYYLRLRVNNGVQWGEWSYSSFVTHIRATIHVPADFATLQEAVSFAVSSDSIIVADGIYSGAGNRDINFMGKNLILVSENGPLSTIIDCEGSTMENHRAFLFENEESFYSVIDGFTIRNGYINGDGGAILCNESAPIIRNCRFENNYCGSHGGAIFFLHVDDYTLEDCYFENNTTEHWGGAVADHSTNIVINNCRFIGNSADYSAAVHLNGGLQAQINNCLFEQNSAMTNAAGIGSYNGAEINAEQCTFVKNTAMNNGSTIHFSGGGNIDRCLIAFATIGHAVDESATFTCCNIFGNPSGDWIGSIAGQLGINGNISLDPNFCDFISGDYSLSVFSPCSPAINTACGLIGLYGVGCSAALPLALNINYGTTSELNVVYNLTPDIYWTYFDTVATVQAAYEIEVGIDEDWSTAEMWSSGQVASTDPHSVYDGAVLVDNQEYYLRMRVSSGTAWGEWTYSTFVVRLGGAIFVPADMPTIQDGINYALDGDTVIVADGIYTGAGNRDINFNGKNVVLKSENGPEYTIIDCEGNASTPHRGFIFINNENNLTVVDGFTVRNGYGQYSHGRYEGGALMTDHASPLIKNCIFTDNNGSHQGGAASCFYGNPVFQSCTFYNNGANYGGGIYSNNSSPIVENCIIAYSYRGWAIDGSAALTCTDLYGNADGDWVANIAGQLNQNGNLNVDPMFCDTAAADFSIAFYSQCSQYYNLDCGLIGASPAACGDNMPVVFNINFGPQSMADTIFQANPAIYWTFFDTLDVDQSMYEIEVGTDTDWTAAEMWSTGQVVSSDTSAVYAGSQLMDGTRYYLRIRANNGINWGGWAYSGFYTHYNNTLEVPGDFATIQEALDYAINGDTIMVADGIYTGTGNRDLSYGGKRIVLMSENGPESTILDIQGSSSDKHRGFNFDGGEDSSSVLKGFSIINGFGTYSHDHFEGGAIMMDSSSPKIIECLFADNYGDHQGGAVAAFNSSAKFVNCTFIRNGASYGGCIYSNGSHPEVRNCILTLSYNGAAIDGAATVSCTDIYGNMGGDWTGNISSQLGENGNISADPEFCGVEFQDYHISPVSPCAAGYNECEINMGAFGTGNCLPRAVLLFDHSGSMFYEDPLGKSRLERAQAYAHEELDHLLKENDEMFPLPYNISIMYFNSDGIVVVQDFGTDSAVLHSAIDAVPPPKHDTPLAAAMCQATCNITDLGNYTGVLITYTDGLENSSQDFTICENCQGCNEFIETGWNSNCQLFGLPNNCTDWQICIGYSLVVKVRNYAHYFGDLLNPFSKDAADHLPDFEFMRYAAEESGGVMYYHSDMATLCGDASSDGLVNLSDAVFIINYVFLGGAAPSYELAADVNCDASVNVSDAVFLINYIFNNGKTPCDSDGDGQPDCGY